MPSTPPSPSITHPSASTSPGFSIANISHDASKWDAILVANLPIFSAGIIEANVRTAWSRLRQAALYQAELRRQIDRDVQIAYDNLITSEKLLVSFNEEVKAANDALNQSQQLLPTNWPSPWTF